MENVMILAETQGFLPTSLREHLETSDCRVVLPGTDIDQITKMISRVSAVLIYADEKLLSFENRQVLIHVRDRAVSDGLAVFLAGSEEELDELYKIFPGDVVIRVFQRPLNVKLAAQEMSDYLHEVHQGRRKKILVVDDSGAMLRNVKGWLEDKYQVILANSGAMAIKYLALNRPDLILLDYEMPIVDGRQVLEMIRSETDFSDVPVIFLTGKDDRESVMSVMEMKPEGYLLKSLRPEQIVQAVDNFFAHKKWTNMSDSE